MVIAAVLGLIKPAEWVRLWRLGRIEFWVAAITAASGLFFGLLIAVAVGVALTLFLVIYELDHLGVSELQMATRDGRRDVEVAGNDTVPLDGLLILRFDGPLYTANIRGVNRKILAAVDAAKPTTLLLDASSVPALTVTVLEQFGDLQRELDARDVTMWFAALPPRSLATAQQLPGWQAAAAEGRVFPTALAAVRAYVETTASRKDPRHGR
jgi:MFS superfamily sulfate permease-like transporter